MSKKGFTLIELAIVLIIIGLLVGGGFKTMQIMQKREKRIETKQKLDDIKNSIVGYAQDNGYLPTQDEYNTLVGNKKDSWGKDIIYYSDDNLKDDICAFNSTSISIGGDYSVSNVAFVIASSGANYNMQTNMDSSVEVYKYNTPNIDDNTSDVGGERKEPYDDFVKWVTLNELKNNLNCTQKEFRFINERLPDGIENSSYSATLYVENNLTSVSISCSPTSSKGISFSSSTNTFSGTPNSSGTAEFTCTASEDDTPSRSITKRYVITIDPDTSSSTGGGHGGGRRP
jgi:prepilin-type N-terminal cleavage/methylation domain-containing protein